MCRGAGRTSPPPARPPPGVGVRREARRRGRSPVEAPAAGAGGVAGEAPAGPRRRLAGSCPPPPRPQRRRPAHPLRPWRPGVIEHVGGEILAFVATYDCVFLSLSNRANLILDLVPPSETHHPANIPTRYWLTPSGVSIPTSENTSEMRSGLSPPQTCQPCQPVHVHGSPQPCSPCVVHPRVLRYLLLRHCPFRARR